MMEVAKSYISSGSGLSPISVRNAICLLIILLHIMIIIIH